MMKRVLWKMSALLCTLFVLTGCVRVVNDIRPSGGNMDITDSGDPEEDDKEDSGTAGGGRGDADEDDGGEAPARASRSGSDETTDDADAEEDTEVKVRLVLSEDAYDEVKQIAANARFAVKSGEFWGVVDADGKEVHDTEYDFIETDGNGLYSLTKKDDGYFDARLMYYDVRSDKEEEVFTNESYPEYDFTEFYSPYITMTTRGSDALSVLYVETDNQGNFEFDFYRLSKFDTISVMNAGMDADKWSAVSGYMKDMTTDGGSFVASEDWMPEGAGYANAVGIDGLNQIVLSEIERNRTIRMMPYAADEKGNYAAYIVELPSGNGSPAYGNIKDLDYSAAGLKEFPSGTEEVIPDLSSGTARAGKNGRAVIANSAGDEAIFNYGTGKAETEFAYKSVLLAGDSRYPSVALEDGKYVYITPEGETRDAGNTEYTGASLYDEEAGYALVIDTDGNLYAIDRNGNRVSEKEEGFEDGSVAYLYGEDSHAFAVETGGEVRFCVVEEAE